MPGSGLSPGLKVRTPTDVSPTVPVPLKMPTPRSAKLTVLSANEPSTCTVPARISMSPANV